MMKKRIKIYCCKKLRNELEDLGMPFKYFPITREYCFELDLEEYPIGNETDHMLKYSVAFERLSFCPWCGTELPKSLRNTYLDILEEEYNIKPPFTYDKEKKIPKEFKSNKWWKNRGL